MESITQIFSNKNVKEVIAIEKKMRNEIEDKKEELRQMVGERYRDLIEAADTISEMKDCCTSVKHSIQDLQQFYTGISVGKGRKLSLVKKSTASTNLNKYMELAAQAKILMEIPEKIWSLVEAGHMTSASFLYLQSLRVLKNLALDGSSNYSPVLLWFPMLGQQAQAVGNLRAAIVKECHHRIADHLLAVERLAEALCSIVILEKFSAMDVLHVLLDARSAALEGILSDLVEGDEREENVRARSQISDGVAIVQQTVLHVFSLFCEGQGGLVSLQLSKCESDSADAFKAFLSQNDSSKIWIKHLSKDLSSFDKLHLNDLTITSGAVQNACLAWFQKCKVTLSTGIQRLLNYTHTARDLADIRNDLLETLCVSGRSASEAEPSDEWADSEPADPRKEKRAAWANACKVIFNRDVQLWPELLRNLFLDKIDQLLQRTFDDLYNSSQSTFSLTSKFQPKQASMFEYLWKESESDIAPNMAWTDWQSRKQADLSAQGGLALKVSAVTPEIREICDEINEKMMRLLTDLDCFAPDVAAAKQNGFAQSTPVVEESDSKEVIERLKAGCYRYLERLLAHISDLESRLSASEDTGSIDCVNSVLHLSFLCRNYFDLCHHFKRCCCRKSDHFEKSLQRQFSGSSSFIGKDRLEKAGIVDAAWQGVVDAMTQKSHTLMTAWCKTLLDDVVNRYRSELLASAANGNLMNAIALWDAIAVEEENESGDKVSSQITIPANVTSYTHNFLYSLCSRLHRVGGHSISRFTLRHLSYAALKAVYKVFSELRCALSVGDSNLHGQSRTDRAAPAPSQAWALQCLFDLRCLNTLLQQPHLEMDDDEADDATDEGTLYTFTELVDWLESYVDPFDLDVFSPHLMHNVQQFTARSCLLFGLLNSPDKLSTSTIQKSVSDLHNVLPLAGDRVRFSYLAVSGRSTAARGSRRISSSLARQLPLASALRGLTHGSDESMTKQENKLSSSIYSKLGALSSSWLSLSTMNDD